MTAPDLSRANWRKSTHSGGTGGNCVEVASSVPATVAVRDSQDRHGPVLLLSHHAWQAFTAALKVGPAR